MEWVLFVSLQWIVIGSPTQPNTVTVESFSSEELCKTAAEAVRAELNASIASQRAQTLGRVVCFEKRSKAASKE